MRPTLPLLIATFSLLSTSLAAPLPIPTKTVSLLDREYSPIQARDLDPVAAALASKLAAIQKQLDKIPVLPTPTPGAGDADEEEEGTTTTSKGRAKNPKFVKNPKNTRLARRSPSPSSSPDAHFANPKHSTPSPSPTYPTFPADDPGAVENPKHVYTYPAGVSTGKWVVLNPSQGGEDLTLEGVSPTRQGTPGRPTAAM
ncbi:hypothetical protein JCM11251_006497 [Rhodosporidiobolus azoricus]